MYTNMPECKVSNEPTINEMVQDDTLSMIRLKIKLELTLTICTDDDKC